MSDTTEKIKAKIAKLMEMAEHEGSNEHEAEIAMRMAERLMRQHSIDEASIHTSEKKPKYTWVHGKWFVNEGRAHRTDSALGTIALGVAVLTDCTCSWNRDGEKGTYIDLCGDAGDVAYAVYLMTHIQGCMARASAKFVGTSGEKGAFKCAFAMRLQDLMKKLKAEQKAALHQVASGSGTALMVMDDKIMQRNAIFGRQRVRRLRTGSGGSEFARDAGRNAANNVGFGRPMEGSAAAVKRISA